jgi:hypothetical protein
VQHEAEHLDFVAAALRFPCIAENVVNMYACMSLMPNTYEMTKLSQLELEIFQLFSV